MSASLARAGLPRLLVVLGAVLITFAANGQSPRTAPRQDVTLRLDWVPTWYHSVFYLALNRGYYSDVGLNLTIGQGQGLGHHRASGRFGLGDVRAHGHVDDDARH